MLDPVAARLVRDGLITVNVVFTQDGIDTWARACRRHPGLDVSPSVSMALVDLLEIFKRHQSIKEMMNPSTPARVTASPTPSPSRGKEAVIARREVKYRPGDQPSSVFNDIEGLSFMPTSTKGFSDMRDKLSCISVENARKIIENDRLGITRENGIVNALPRDSLTKVDLERRPLHVFARMVSVADHIGNDKLVARIRSNPRLSLPVVSDLASWWSSATLKDRIILLSNNSKLKVTSTLGSLDERQLRGLSEFPHPFRGDPEDLVFEEYSPREQSSDGEGLHN